MSKSHVFNRLIVAGSLLALGTMASGCSSLDRLAAIGEKPKLSAIDNPTTQAGYKPVSMPMPAPQPGEVLVRVKASGVNPSDVKGRAGLRARMTVPA